MHSIPNLPLRMLVLPTLNPLKVEEGGGRVEGGGQGDITSIVNNKVTRWSRPVNITRTLMC